MITDLFFLGLKLQQVMDASNKYRPLRNIKIRFFAKLIEQCQTESAQRKVRNRYYFEGSNL